MEKETEKEGVPKDEFEAFAKAVKDAICDIQKHLQQPREVELRFYRCGEQGCTYQTDDLGAFVEHTVGERLKRQSSESPTEEEFGYGEQPKRRHTSPEELMDCPDCAPKFERTLAALGWQKPQPKPYGGLKI